MQLCQTMANGKPQPESAELLGDQAVSLLERSEDSVQCIWLDANSVVLNRDGEQSAHSLDIDDDGPVIRRELHRVSDDVPEHLL